MKEKMITSATNFFVKLGFKSVCLIDIVSKVIFSKKTIYKSFSNNKLFISESSNRVNKAVQSCIKVIVAQNYNAIEENFELRKRFKEQFISSKSSPIYQLKKHYPEIYNALISKEIHECKSLFKQNIEKGIQEGLYRNDINLLDYASFYYLLIFGVNENTCSENDLMKMELQALEYHTRAMATEKGIAELEKKMLLFRMN